MATLIDCEGDEATPDVTLTYKRLGQIAPVADLIGNMGGSGPVRHGMMAMQTGRFERTET